METESNWMWNEFQQVGADFSNLAEVEEYDRRMGQLRDVEQENRQILDLLGLAPTAHVVDLGAGTGHFVRAAARSGLEATAVDISTTMLDYARREAEQEKLDGIHYANSGFLSLDFPSCTFDAAHTSAALHHLPDTWKSVALDNVYRVLKPDGQFILRDVVFDWGEANYASYFDTTVQSLSEEMRPRMASHIATEYSTLEWIMTGLLERSGFSIQSIVKPLPYFRVYHCRKQVV